MFLAIALQIALSCFPPPVIAPIVEHFEAPVCQFCPGHRGVEFELGAPSVVTAVASGVVTFAGSVAGVRYVVVRHDEDGLQATYGRLITIDVVAGDPIRAGQIVGRAADVLYFGLRRNGDYIDPEPLLGRVVRRARLVPIDGEGARPAEPGRLRCGARRVRNLVIGAAATALPAR